MSITRFTPLAAALIGVALSSFAPQTLAAGSPNDTVATVNGKPLPQFKVDAVIRVAQRQGQKDSPELQRFAKEEAISRELLQQEAERRGIAGTEDFRQALEQAKTDLMIASLQMDLARKEPIKDEEIRAEYDRYKKNLGSAEFHLRHILVPTEAEAQAIIAKLKKGSKFEELAKQSKDPGTAGKGGDLGWVPANSVFGDAPGKLGKGKFSETPFKSAYGYHVLRLDDSREAKLAAYEDVKPRIIQALERKRMVELQEDLRKKAKIQ